MKVVLKKAVIKLGVPGDVVDVAAGYAFNYLIPTKHALFASPENLAEFETKKQELLKEHEAFKAKAMAVKNAIEGKFLLLEKPVNDAGNLYAVINPMEVATALNEQYSEHGFEFNKNQILISNKIRNYGVYDFTVTLYNGVIAKLKLSIALNKVLAEAATVTKEEVK